MKTFQRRFKRQILHLFFLFRYYFAFLSKHQQIRLSQICDATEKKKNSIFSRVVRTIFFLLFIEPLPLVAVNEHQKQGRWTPTLFRHTNNEATTKVGESWNDTLSFWRLATAIKVLECRFDRGWRILKQLLLLWKLGFWRDIVGG